MTALLAVPLVGLVAFAVDAGWMVLAQSDLQNAADAAALAGAQQLIGQSTYNSSSKMYSLTNGFVDYYLPNQTASQQTTILNAATTAASKSAKDFASYSTAGGVSSLVLKDADIEFGITDSQGTYSKLSSPYSQFPNTIKVTIRLDSSANGALPLFFAPVLGAKNKTLTATASATIYAGTLNSFQTPTTFKSGMLPMTYDQDHWNYFLKNGKSIDGVTSTDGNGTPQLSIYPSGKYTGNFGLLSLDDSSDGASTISGWIDSGVSSSDLQSLINANLIPLSAHDATKWDWKGNSGLKDGDVKDLSSHIGDTYLMPLFKAYNTGASKSSDYAAGSGQGTNYYYDIVQFVSVKLTAVDSSGKNKSVMVVPAAYIDPNAVFSSISPATAPASGSASLVTTFSSAKLTQ
jgi:Flp pilus assembly protein TadG